MDKYPDGKMDIPDFKGKFKAKIPFKIPSSSFATENYLHTFIYDTLFFRCIPDCLPREAQGQGGPAGQQPSQQGRKDM
jgi:hypothetical protein